MFSKSSVAQRNRQRNRTAFELGPPSRKRERPEWLWRKTTENTECTEKKKPDKWQMTNDKFPMTNFFARRPGTPGTEKSRKPLLSPLIPNPDGSFVISHLSLLRYRVDEFPPQGEERKPLLAGGEECQRHSP
jgi:hypothetical protein